MTATILAGMQWGDEGKGKVSDVLAGGFDLVARFSGGINACHRVVVEGREQRFSLVPSAALRPDTTLVLTDGVLVEPDNLVREIELLRERYGFDPQRLHIGRNAVVTLPYHIQLDQASDRAAGERAIGTTGWGVGPTRLDQVARQGVRLHEYLDPEFMARGLPERVVHDLTPARLLSRLPGMVNHMPQRYEHIREILGPRLADTSKLLNDALDAGRRVLFEGSQGALLDVTHGGYPYVTSSSTIAGAACAGSGIGPTRIDEVVGITKAYSTRVSHGPLPTELDGEQAAPIVQAGHEYRHTTDVPLRVGWLDLVALRYAVRLNAPAWLAVTKLDALDPCDEVKVCVGYRRGSEVVEEMPPDLARGQWQPVYETLPGWPSPCLGAERFDELPARARDYLARIEAATGVPVRLVSTGPERHQVCVDPDLVRTPTNELSEVVA